MFKWLKIIKNIEKAIDVLSDKISSIVLTKHFDWFTSFVVTVFISTMAFIGWETVLKNSINIWVYNNLYYVYINVYTLMIGSLVYKWSFFVAVGLSILHTIYFFKFKGDDRYIFKDRDELVDEIERLKKELRKTGRELLRHYNASLYQETFNKFLMNFVPIPIVIIDEHRDIVDCNPATEALLKFDKDEMVNGMKLERITTSIKDKEFLIEKHRTRKSNPYQLIPKYNIKIQDRYGNIKIVSLTLRHITNSVKTIVTIHDKTEQTRLENKLVEKDTLATQLLTYSNRYIWKKDMYGRYTFCDRKFCEDYFGLLTPDGPKCNQSVGFTEKELIRNYINNNDKVHGFISKGVDTDKLTMENNRVMRFIEMGIIDDKLFILDILKSPELDDDGNVIGVISSATNRTNEGINAANEISQGIRKGSIKCLFESAAVNVFSVEHKEYYDPIVITDLKNLKIETKA